MQSRDCMQNAHFLNYVWVTTLLTRRTVYTYYFAATLMYGWMPALTSLFDNYWKENKYWSSILTLTSRMRYEQQRVKLWQLGENARLPIDWPSNSQVIFISSFDSTIRASLLNLRVSWAEMQMEHEVVSCSKSSHNVTSRFCQIYHPTPSRKPFRFPSSLGEECRGCMRCFALSVTRHDL